MTAPDPATEPEPKVSLGELAKRQREARLEQARERLMPWTRDPDAPADAAS